MDLVDVKESSDSSKWICAIEEEMQSLLKNQTWDLVPLPKGNCAIGCKWIYKVKDDGRYKARLVVTKFAQRKGKKYDEIFALVVFHTSIQIFLALVAIYDLELEQLDVKSTFFHDDLDEDI